MSATNPIVTVTDTVYNSQVEINDSTEEIIVHVEELGAQGIEGKSAYQIAVENGYTGTEAEFGELLASVSKKENKLNWWTLLVSANAKVLLTNDTAGKLYKYTYGTIDLYRFIKADKTEDSFYLEEAKTTLIATRFSTINL
jgi:hypothetical protein